MDYISTAVFLSIIALIFSASQSLVYAARFHHEYRKSIQFDIPSEIWVFWMVVALLGLVLSIWALYYVGQMWWFDLQDHLADAVRG